MTENEVLKLFKEYNAFLKGHFRLSSGLHSGEYLQAALVLQHPEIAELLSKEIAKKFSKEKIDLVIGPALGGITLSHEIARQLGVRSIFAEREDARMTLRRGFSINKGEKALVAEDVITTGGSTKEVMALVENSGGKVAGVGAIIDRSEQEIDFGVRFESLAKVKIDTFRIEDCPLCKKNVPLTKPGSRR